jgi:hypothetical protein
LNRSPSSERNGLSDIYPAVERDLAGGVFSNKSVTAAQMASLTGRPLVFDSTAAGGRILTRTWLTGGQPAGFVPGGSEDSAEAKRAKRTFEVFFSNTVHAFDLNQKDALGTEAHTALRIKASFAGKAIHAYLYNGATNRYAAIPCYMDAAGYIHVRHKAGGTLVFTDAPLKRKQAEPL